MEEVTLDDTWLMAGDPPNKGDEALFVRFRMHPVKDDAATKEAGRPMFKNVEFVTISGPGDKFNQIDRPASLYDKRRFRRQYQALKANAEDTGSGTPLSKWPLIDAAQVMELKYFSVHTVEQLALMPDGNIPNVGNISHLKKNAVDFLALAKGNAPLVQMRGELEKRDQMLSAMQVQMDEQAKLIHELSTKKTESEPAPSKKRRGQSDEAATT
jgi:hypothetical protein